MLAVNYPYYKKRCITLLGVLSLILLTSVQGRSQTVKQEYTYKHYTIHDGLSQMQVMSLFQDRKGYLWCSTKAGLSRFDGKHFKGYPNTSINLSGFDIPVLDESERGDLLVLGPSQISVLVGDSVQIKPFPEYLRGSSLFPKSQISNLQMVLHQGTNKKWLPAVMDYSNSDSVFVIPHDSSFGEIVGFHHANKALMWQAKSDTLTLYNIESREIEEYFPCKEKLIKVFGNREQIYAISESNSIYKLENDCFEFVFQVKGRSRYFDVIPKPDNSGLIIKTDTELFLYDGELKTIKKNLTSIRAILFDNEENLWVATEEGLYNFFQLNFVNYTFGMGNKDWVWSVIEDDQNHFWFASYQNGIWKWDGNTIHNYTDHLNARIGSHLSTREAPDQYRYYMGASKHKGAIYFPTECNVLQYKNELFSPVSNILELPYQITKALPDESVVFAGYAGLFRKYTDESMDSWTRDSVGISSILNVEVDSKNRIMAVGKGGVALVGKDSIQRYTDPWMRYNYSTAKDHKNNIWIGGLKHIKLYNEDSIRKVWNREEEAFYSMLFLEPYYLFIGGIKGLYVVNLDYYYRKGIFEAVLFNQSSGFTGIECGQNGFFTDSEGMVWIPTSDLITRFDPQKLIEKEIKPPSIFLNLEISPNNIDWEAKVVKNERLQFVNNNLRFKTDVISYANAGNTRFYYQLEGLQDSWSEATEINEITFYDLKPGRYIFRVKADSGILSSMSETIEVPFVISWPFWLKWYVLAVELILFLLFVFLLVHYLIQREKKKSIAKQRLIQLRSEALAAQLDPHFVMNCLNNISGLVNAGHKKQANEYIVKFSKLLRVILESVKKESISLSAELDMLEKYLQLEQFRCNKCFEYNIDLPKNYSTQNIIVPPMMLQPLVENSIKHGFINKNIESPFIQITVWVVDQDLLFMVSDNGSGLSQAASTSGTGLGAKITKERIELLQKKNNIEFSIRDNNPGVEVRFKIPFVLHTES